MNTLIQNSQTYSASGIDVLIGGSPAFTKLLSANWAAGSNQGGLDQGAVVAGGTYHLFEIQNETDQSIDAIFSASATSPAVPSGYVIVQVMGAVMVDGSSVIMPFLQSADIFRLRNPTRVNVSLSQSPTICNLPVPLGFKPVVQLLVDLQTPPGASGGYSCLFDADLGPLTIGPANCCMLHDAGGSGVVEKAQQVFVITNAAGQIYVGDDGSSSVRPTAAIIVQSWTDKRLSGYAL